MAWPAIHAKEMQKNANRIKKSMYSYVNNTCPIVTCKHVKSVHENNNYKAKDHFEKKHRTSLVV
jgi:hypothetical protein